MIKHGNVVVGETPSVHGTGTSTKIASGDPVRGREKSEGFEEVAQALLPEKPKQAEPKTEQ